MEVKLSLSGFRPIKQGLLTLACILLFDLVSYASNTVGEKSMGVSMWTNAVALMFFYVIINCIIAMVSGAKAHYFRESLYTFLGLGLLAILVSTNLSGFTMDEAGSFRWLLVVVTMCYMIFLAIINTIQILVKFAEKLGSGPKNGF